MNVTDEMAEARAAVLLDRQHRRAQRERLQALLEAFMDSAPSGAAIAAVDLALGALASTEGRAEGAEAVPKIDIRPCAYCATDERGFVCTRRCEEELDDGARRAAEGPQANAATPAKAEMGSVPAPQCSPTLTECSRCKNDFRNCDGFGPSIEACNASAAAVAAEPVSARPAQANAAEPAHVLAKQIIELAYEMSGQDVAAAILDKPSRALLDTAKETAKEFEAAVESLRLLATPATSEGRGPELSDEQFEKLGREAGMTVYRNRHAPDEPYYTFGPKAWAKFCAVLAARAVAPKETK